MKIIIAIILSLIVLVSVMLDGRMWGLESNAAEMSENQTNTTPNNLSSQKHQRSDLDLSFLRLTEIQDRDEASDFVSTSAPYLHPKCLAHLEVDEETTWRHCADAKWSQVEIDRDKQITRVIYDEGKDGYTGYRIFNQNTASGVRYQLLALSWNGGGSGVFSVSLIVGHLLDSDEYIVLLQKPHGDRCNDGYVDDFNLDGKILSWSEAATHFRLLNPKERIRKINTVTNQLPETFEGLEPYDDVSNAALYCVGRVQYAMDIETGEEVVNSVVVDSAKWQRWEQGTMASCLQEWGRQEFDSNETLTIPINTWELMLNDLSTTCNAEKRDQIIATENDVDR